MAPFVLICLFIFIFLYRSENKCLLHTKTIPSRQWCKIFQRLLFDLLFIWKSNNNRSIELFRTSLFFFPKQCRRKKKRSSSRGEWTGGHCFFYVQKIWSSLLCWWHHQNNSVYGGGRQHRDSVREIRSINNSTNRYRRTAPVCDEC